MRLIGNLTSPWLPGALEAMSEAGFRLDIVLFDPVDAVGYTDAARQGLKDRLDSLRSLGGHQLEVHASDGKSALHYVKFGRSLRRRWKNDGTPLITMYGGGLALAAAASGIRPRIHYLMGSDVLRLGRGSRLLIRTVYRSANLLIANGDYLAREAANFTKRSVQPVLLGVDLEKFKPGSPSDEPVQIICPRGMLEVYDNSTILSALKRMADHEWSSPTLEFPVQHPLWHARFLAGGPQLESLRAASSLPEVSFDGGCSSDQMVNALQSGHIVVSMSRSDGSSTAVWEALACGLTPILSRIPANEVFRPVAGLIDVGDDVDLALALRVMVQNPPDWSVVRSRMRRFAEEHADAAQNMRRLREFVEAL